MALSQAEEVAEMLRKVSGHSCRLVKIRSEGDLDGQTPLHSMAGRGVFASEVQEALLKGAVDVAVHSLKDLLLEVPKMAPVTAIPPRGTPTDVAVHLRESCDAEAEPPIKRGSRLGTSSPRRQSQLLSLNRDLVPVDVRGNVETRLRKLREGWVDGLVLAEAAVERLPPALFDGLVLSRLPLETFPTCPGQGALAVQTPAEGEVADLARTLDDKETRTAVEAERKLLALLGGGCGMPLGATVRKDGGVWTIDASLATEGWREEEPTRLARHHLCTGDLDVALKESLAILTKPHKRSVEPRQSRHLKILLVADDETSRQYRMALEPEGVEVECWYPFDYEMTLAGELQRDLIDAWKKCSWVALTSRRAVGGLETLIREVPRKGPWVAAVGPRTASDLRRRELPVHYVSKGGTASALATELAAVAKKKGDVFLHLSAKDARDEFVEGLRRLGREVIQHAVYMRLKPRRVKRPKETKLNAVVVFSPKGATAILETLGKGAAKHWVAIGPTTAQALETKGVRGVRVAKRRTPSGVLEALGWAS